VCLTANCITYLLLQDALCQAWLQACPLPTSVPAAELELAYGSHNVQLRRMLLITSAAPYDKQYHVVKSSMAFLQTFSQPSRWPSALLGEADVRNLTGMGRFTNTLHLKFCQLSDSKTVCCCIFCAN